MEQVHALHNTHKHPPKPKTLIRREVLLPPKTSELPFSLRGKQERSSHQARRLSGEEKVFCAKRELHAESEKEGDGEKERGREGHGERERERERKKRWREREKEETSERKREKEREMDGAKIHKRPLYIRRFIYTERTTDVFGVAECCSVLQCVAVCCSVLQYVAVCCSEMQCV